MSYCTVENVAARLTNYGLTRFADVGSRDGDLDSEEMRLVVEAISYATALIDAAVARYRNGGERPQSLRLTHLAVDVAAFRIATLGGRNTSAVLTDDYTRARDEIERIQSGDLSGIPGIAQTLVTPSGQSVGVSAINLR